MPGYSLTHLKQLEAESIHILREVVAEFENPVMLYSIGKDSSVMVRLAQKAFYPGKLPFSLLHINTAPEALGINPFDHGSQKYTTVMKTHALLQAIEKWGFDAAFGGARRDE